jgi:hypothetical protein
MASVGDIIRVTCRFKNASSGDVVNVYHFYVVSGASPTDDEVVADIEDAIDAAYTQVATVLSSDTDPYDIRFDVVEMSGGVERVIRNITTKTWTLTTPPSTTGDELPQQNAAIVNLRTIYPRVFGRKYLGALCEASNADGILQPTALGKAADFAATLIGDIVGTYVTLKAGVLSAKADPVIGYFAEFVGYVANSITGIQRRRRIQRGS